MNPRVFSLAFLSLLVAKPLLAAVSLPGIISDHAVLKASAATCLWGKAAPGENVSVAIAGKAALVQAGADGNWQVQLDLLTCGPGPFDLTVKGTNELTVKDILIGETWLASGQSNMDFPLKDGLDAPADIPQSANPQIRFFICPRLSNPVPQEDVRGSWLVADPANVGRFSAVAYYFSRTVQAAIQKPVGVVQTSFGGSSVEAWISPAALDTDPDLKAARERIWRNSDDARTQREVFSREFPKWIQATQRQDHPPADTALFAAPNLDTTGWQPVELKGKLEAPGLPATGAIWIRREVQVAANGAGKKTLLRVGAVDARDTVFINGKKVREKAARDYFGPGSIYLDVPGDQIVAGRNVLAIRLYAPVNAPTFSGDPITFAGKTIPDGWLAKAEYAFPEIANLPPPPAYPIASLEGRVTASYLWNAMLRPFQKTTLSGFIWYQGEQDTSRSWQYRTSFPLLITSWRQEFGQGDLPFYFCQLANFKSKVPQPVENDWAEMRDAQFSALKLSQTGQAVNIDVGESDDIHYLNKKPVGERLAALALNRTYNRKEVVPSGPIYSGNVVEGDTLRINFSETAGGLVAQPLAAVYPVNRLRGETAPLVRNSPQSELEGFQICGADRKWVWANARIDGASVLVSASGLASPVAVRYAWSANPTANLTSSAGIPASPFRTDDFPLTTVDRKL